MFGHEMAEYYGFLPHQKFWIVPGYIPSFWGLSRPYKSRFLSPPTPRFIDPVRFAAAPDWAENV